MKNSHPTFGGTEVQGSKETLRILLAKAGAFHQVWCYRCVCWGGGVIGSFDKVLAGRQSTWYLMSLYTPLLSALFCHHLLRLLEVYDRMVGSLMLTFPTQRPSPLPLMPLTPGHGKHTQHKYQILHTTGPCAPTGCSEACENKTKKV